MTQDTKEHILDVSLTLFLQKSYKAVTMKDIVTEAGLSKGAFYHYFESKQQLFEEVVKYFFLDEMSGEFDHYDQSSLKKFYNQVIEGSFNNLKSFEKKVLSAKEREKKHTPNRYSLIFDAVTYIPNFRDHAENHNRMELETWKTVIANAKKSEEINSRLPDEKIAKMFVYMGDGYGMHFILMNKNITEMEKSFQDMKSLWDSLYQLLKA